MYTQVARWLNVGHGPKVPVQHPCLTYTVLLVWSFCGCCVFNWFDPKTVLCHEMLAILAIWLIVLLGLIAI